MKRELPTVNTSDLHQGEWVFVDSQTALQDAATALRDGIGPIAIDAERASGFTYFSRVYLIQVARPGAGTFIIDPLEVDDLFPLSQALEHEEWIFHAAVADLDCLEEVGLVPDEIFDTEVSARLLGYEKVGLGSMVEELLGVHLAKSHSAANWSTRPLPHSWLEYAALDVAYLPKLREALERELRDTGKWEIAQQEFTAVLSAPPKLEPLDPWRKLSGLGKVKQRIGLAVARELWLARDRFAQEQDIAPGRLLPDASIVAVSMNIPRSITELQRNKAFRGRASRSEIQRWWRAILSAKERRELPPMKPALPSAIPHHRHWERKNPAAHARLIRAKELLTRESERLLIPLENLLKPSVLRELAWSPPPLITDEAVAEGLQKLGARPWQQETTAPLIAKAFVEVQ